MTTDNCTAPPNVAASSVVYNQSVAIYSCSTGYSLNGYSQIECVGTEWIGTLPTCEYLIAPNEFDFDHTINFLEETPLWITIVVGGVGIMGVLLLFTCLLICCMHLCGCYSGPLMGVGGTHVYAENHCAPCRMRCCNPAETLSDISEPVRQNTKPIEMKEVKEVKTPKEVNTITNVKSQTNLAIEDDWRPPTPMEPSDRGRFARTVSELMAKQPKKWSPHSKNSLVP